MTQGSPIWFELATADAEASGAFYGPLFGWEAVDCVMPGYHLARQGADVVAGLMVPDDDQCGPPAWTIYFEVDDTDAIAAAVEAAGGQVLMPPQDVPGTGRFAVLADPQGASFGILHPLPMDPPAPEGSGAWNQKKTGRGNWIELMSTDPAAGFAFYTKLFGWKAEEVLDMGEMGSYQLFSHQGATIGAVMGLGDAPEPQWLPYFGVDDVAVTIAAIRAAGGQIAHGPIEVPGPALIAVATDPQGAWFAVVGPKP